MGVPLVTLAGNSLVSRLGVGFLNQVNRKDWIANSEDEYVEIAFNLASDINELSFSRKKLWQDVKSSALMNGELFSQNMDVALRYMWNTWCKKKESK